MKKLLLLSYFATLLLSCKQRSFHEEADVQRSTTPERRPDLLPSNTKKGAKPPWGGTDEKKWRPEAIVANASSAILNAIWDGRGIKDVVVSIPVKMHDSGYRPYGDGQSNAKPSFESWQHPSPPFAAWYVTYEKGKSKLYVQFHEKIHGKQKEIEIAYKTRRGVEREKIRARTTKDGHLLGIWQNIPKELDWENSANATAIYVRPSPGFSDWFPVSTRHPVKPINTLLESVPKNMRTFADGKSIVDGEGLAQKDENDSTPFEKAIHNNWPKRYNPGEQQRPYNPKDIHARFPKDGIVTGVGQGWTWVSEGGPFKIMYTCFEKRQPDEERKAHDGGVASGGGWHRIGDPAETILNSVERAPAVVGFGVEDIAKLAEFGPPEGAISYGLTDITTYRLLWPGEAFITAKGEFHWFYFHFDRHVCTEEWVHTCVPSKTNPDFKCE